MDSELVEEHPSYHNTHTPLHPALDPATNPALPLVFCMAHVLTVMQP